jgi:hypothetical protein
VSAAVAPRPALGVGPGRGVLGVPAGRAGRCGVRRYQPGVAHAVRPRAPVGGPRTSWSGPAAAGGSGRVVARRHPPLACSSGGRRRLPPPCCVPAAGARCLRRWCSGCCRSCGSCGAFEMSLPASPLPGRPWRADAAGPDGRGGQAAPTTRRDGRAARSAGASAGVYVCRLSDSGCADAVGTTWLGEGRDLDPGPETTKSPRAGALRGPRH